VGGVKGLAGIVVGVMAALILVATYGAWIRTKFIDEQMAHLIRDREDFLAKEIKLRNTFNDIHYKLLACRSLRIQECQLLLGNKVVVVPSKGGFAAIFPYTIREYVGHALLYIPAGTVVR